MRAMRHHGRHGFWEFVNYSTHGFVFWLGVIFSLNFDFRPLAERTSASNPAPFQWKWPIQTVAHFPNFCSPFSTHFLRTPKRRMDTSINSNAGSDLPDKKIDLADAQHGGVALRYSE